MPDPIIPIIQALTAKVDRLAADVAVLKDRRSDSEDFQTRISKLETVNAARTAKEKLLYSLLAAGSAASGAGLVKLIGLFGK